MKRRTINLILIALFGIVFLAVGVLTATDVPDEILLTPEGYKHPKTGPTKFNHKEHAVELKIACTECHHDYKDGKNVWKEGDPVKKCSECHDRYKKQGNVMKLEQAYHKNCRDCHRAEYKKGKKKAPYRKCNDCHEKK